MGVCARESEMPPAQAQQKASKPFGSNSSKQQRKQPPAVLKRWHVLPPLLMSCVASYFLNHYYNPQPEAMADFNAAVSQQQAAKQQRPPIEVPDGADCADEESVAASCPEWAAMGECESNPQYMLHSCARSCGCKEPPPHVRAVWHDAQADAGQSAAASATSSSTSSGDEEEPACVDRDKSGACATWAEAGECEANPAFMKLKCAASCNTCDWLDYKKRCPMPPDRVPAVGPGVMSETFERALSEFPELGPKVLSRGGAGSKQPWVMTFDHFLTSEEVDAILVHGEGR